MIELSVRLLVAAGLLGAPFVFGQPAWGAAWPLAMGFAAFSAGVWWAEGRGLRNRGIAGFVAVLDAMFIATVLAEVGQLSSFGFLVLAPMMWATGRFGSDAASMAPLVAATVMVSGNFFEEGGFTLPVLLHTLGILVVGLLTNQAKVVLKETQVPVEVTKEVYVESGRDEALETNFRQLKEHVRDLEKKGRRDSVSMRVYTAGQQKDEPFFSAMASTLGDACEVGGVAVYTFDATVRKMVGQSYFGSYPKGIRDLSFDVPGDLGDAMIRDQVEKRMLRMREVESPVQVGTILLKDRGRLVGMVAMFDKNIHNLDNGLRAAGDAADALGPMVAGELRKEDFQRRLRESEILYGVASVTIGAEKPQHLVSRILRELGDTVRFDHLAVFFVEGDEAIQIASDGVPCRLFEEVSFAAGTGLRGWLGLGGPEVVIPDTLDDDRVEKALAMKRRIGSYLMVPLVVDGEVYGFFSAATHAAAGIDAARQGTLRVIAAETSQALTRLVRPTADPEGVMTPKEFFEAVRSGRSGHLVYFDVLRRDDAIDKYGKPALDHALRKMVRSLRSKLPSGGALCRRDEGDYVAFIPVTDEDSARGWANQVTAGASLIALSTPDGRAKIPLALRAKVAQLSPQKHQVSGSRLAS